MNTLARDALEVLCLLRTLKNSFVPINQIPPEVLSLIPGYFDDGGGGGGDDVDQSIITLTHVCRGWRDMFTSRSSLWTRLDFTNVHKTRTYIQRSQSSPLEIYLESTVFLDDAFSLAIPHLRRLKSLTICADALPDVLRHFRCQAPLLEELDISVYHSHDSILDRALFDRDLSSLRKLTLFRVTMHLPWNNMANLKVLNLILCPPGHDITRLLNFFESAPLLHTVKLHDSLPDSSNAPAQRIVPLSYLKALTINVSPSPSILLNHLCIPTGASLILKSLSGHENSPLPDCLPEAPANLKNLSHITTINLLFNLAEKSVRLSGPSGSLRVLVHWWHPEIDPYIMHRRILRSLGLFNLSTTTRLTISMYRHPAPAEAKESPVFRTLSSTNNLRTLTLIECDNLPFVLALNPEENPSKLTLCPKMEELVLYIKLGDTFPITQLIGMAKNRVSRGAKLSSITIVGLDELALGRKLGKYVTDVKCRVDDAPPSWDHIPSESGDESSKFWG